MSEWKEHKLGEIISLHRGYDLPSSQRKKGTIPIVSSSGISDYHDSYKMLPPGVVTGRYGTIGEVFFLNEPYWPLNTTLYIDDFKGNDPLFIYYFLKSFDFEKFNDKSTIPGINRNHLYGEVVKIPTDIDEQKRISSILSSLDDKIDLLNRENATLEAMAETLFRQWFIEEAKEDWEEGKLGDEFEFIMGQSPSGDSFNEDGIGVPMYQGNADFGFRFPSRRIFTTQPTRFADTNDTLISVRAPVGAQNMATERCCIGRGVAAFRYKKNPSYYSYTYYKLKSLLEEIKQFNDNGTVFGSISKADFESLDVVMPDKETILNYQQQVKAIDDKIINNYNEIKTLIQTRDGLLPRLMSNEINI